jgi:hypothetical protein
MGKSGVHLFSSVWEEERYCFQHGNEISDFTKCRELLD